MTPPQRLKNMREESFIWVLAPINFPPRHRSICASRLDISASPARRRPAGSLGLEQNHARFPPEVGRILHTRAPHGNDRFGTRDLAPDLPTIEEKKSTLLSEISPLLQLQGPNDVHFIVSSPQWHKEQPALPLDLSTGDRLYVCRSLLAGGINLSGLSSSW